MEVPVSDDMATKQGLLDIRLEEEMSFAFDLTDSGAYLSGGTVEGQILVDFKVNQAALLDRLGRAESPPITDRGRLLFEGVPNDDAADGSITDSVSNLLGSSDSAHTQDEGSKDQSPSIIDQFSDRIEARISEDETDRLELDYGRLLIRGADAVGLDSSMPLTVSFSRETLENTATDELNRQLRMTENYDTTYDELKQHIRDAVANKGHLTEPSFIAPIHVQASAVTTDESLQCTIQLTNNEQYPINSGTVSIDIPTSIGSAVSLGHNDDKRWADQSAVSGSYNPESTSYDLRVDGIDPAGGKHDTREIQFRLPKYAANQFSEISGSVRLTRNRPFSDIEIVGVFDAGGYNLNSQTVSTTTVGHINGTFTTPITTAETDTHPQTHSPQNSQEEQQHPQQAKGDSQTMSASTDESLLPNSETTKAEESSVTVSEQLNVTGQHPEAVIEAADTVLADELISGYTPLSPDVQAIPDGESPILKYEAQLQNGAITATETPLRVSVTVDGTIPVPSAYTTEELNAHENLQRFIETTHIDMDEASTTVVIKATGPDTSNPSDPVQRLYKMINDSITTSEEVSTDED